uniref:THAP-type domain-containing protein n=1 Tax=Moschus moschiferus TaxID=68415 RepID=A0A8C6FUU3_MOSMO
MPNFCAAPNCTRKSTQSDLAFFRFPRDPARCQKWVEKCRRVVLEDKTPDQLNKHYRLCAKHFETSMICRTKSDTTERLHFHFSLSCLGVGNGNPLQCS